MYDYLPSQIYDSSHMKIVKFTKQLIIRKMFQTNFRVFTVLLPRIYYQIKNI